MTCIYDLHISLNYCRFNDSMGVRKGEGFEFIEYIFMQKVYTKFRRSEAKARIRINELLKNAGIAKSCRNMSKIMFLLMTLLCKLEI